MIDPKDVYISTQNPRVSFEKTVQVVLVFLGIYLLFKNIHRLGDIFNYIEEQWVGWNREITRQIDDLRLKMHVKNGTFYQSIHKNI